MERPSLPPVEVYGATWFPGNGAKARMRAVSAAIDAKCELKLRDPDSGRHHFGCYRSWSEATEHLKILEVGPPNRPVCHRLNPNGPEIPNITAPSGFTPGSPTRHTAMGG